MFKELQESLEETSKAKAHLQSCLNSSGLVVITLDSDGKMVRQSFIANKNSPQSVMPINWI